MVSGTLWTMRAGWLQSRWRLLRIRMGRWDGQGWRNREYAKKVWCSPSVEKSAEGFFICQKVVESRMMLWYYKCAAVPPAEGRWFYMNDNISAFIISVAASVVGYYICKWLDRWWTGGNSLNGLARRKEQEKPQRWHLRGFSFCSTRTLSAFIWLRL